MRTSPDLTQKGNSKDGRGGGAIARHRDAQTLLPRPAGPRALAWTNTARHSAWRARQQTWRVNEGVRNRGSSVGAMAF
eukprot:4741184-Pyramimonas_sp.AAC.1